MCEWPVYSSKFFFFGGYKVSIKFFLRSTFGPRMSPADGRVVSNFIMQAIKGEPLTLYGDGEQTRSFQYVHDLVDGLILLMNKNYSEPVNLGNPEEYTIRNFADMIRDLVVVSFNNNDTDKENNDKKHVVDIKILPAALDDPKKRKPDITRAKKYLGWEPGFSVKQGLQETVDWFQLQVKEGAI